MEEEGKGQEEQLTPKQGQEEQPAPYMGQEGRFTLNIEQVAPNKKLHYSKKTVTIGLVAVVVILAILLGIVGPLILDRDKNQYLTEISLKEAVDIENLSTIDYTYKGIAEKADKFLWVDTVDCRVRYEVHIRASYDMDQIEFTIDETSKTVTAYIPEVQIGTPVLDENKFGYLPESATPDMRDILALCKEDAARDVNQDELKREADESLRNIVTALTMPLLGDEFTLDFKSLSEYPSREEGLDESE